MYFIATVELLFSKQSFKRWCFIKFEQYYAIVSQKKGTIDHTMEYIVSKFVSVHLALVVNCQINTSVKR